MHGLSAASIPMMISCLVSVSARISRGFPLSHAAEIDLSSRNTKRLHTLLCKLFTQVCLGFLIRNFVKDKQSAFDMRFRV
jgi:hypothetical protein